MRKPGNSRTVDVRTRPFIERSAHLAYLCFLVAVLLSACSDSNVDGELDDGFDVAFEFNPSVGTVVTVTFRYLEDVDEEDAGHVEFGPSLSYGQTAPATRTDTGEFEAVLLGLKPRTEYHCRVHLGRPGSTILGADRTLTTGSPPSSLPDLSLEHHVPDESAGGYRIFPLLTTPSSVVIVDSDGDYVWWHTALRSSLTVISRASVSRDGEWVLFLDRTSDDEGESLPALFRVRLDGTETRSHTIAGGHHDFVELPDGTVAIIQEDVRTVGDEMVIGDRIVELDEDGNETVVWSVWDDQTYPGGADEGDWTHANAIDYDADQGAYYLSMRNLDSIYRIDRTSGTVLQQLGGESSDVVLLNGDNSLFVQQHQFHHEADELLVFDNGDDIEGGSRIVDYDIDLDAGTAELDSTFSPDPPVFCYSLGDVSRLHNGNMMVVWSTAGWIEELDPSNDSVWRLASDLGAGFGYTEWFDIFYP